VTFLHVDTREPKGLQSAVHHAICKAVHPMADCTAVTIRALPCGDFAILDQCTPVHWLGIERKHDSDLLSSLTGQMANGNHRLQDQLERMSREYTDRILIIEGQLSHDPTTGLTLVGTSLRQSGWRYAAVQMILWGIQHGPRAVDILNTTNQAGTAEVLRVLYQRAQSGCVLPSACANEAAAA
jgi:ERCC4-type nuclease